MNTDLRYPHETFIAICLNNDDFYQSKKDKIRHDIYPWPELSQIAYLLKNYNNTVEQIYLQLGKEMAGYAIEIANNLAQHEIRMKQVNRQEDTTIGDWTSLEIEYKKKGIMK